MRARADGVGILLRLALRNLRLHWVRTLIVGFLLTVGTWLVVVGQGALDAIHHGMQRSVVDTLSGHLQIYSGDAKDDLELYQSAVLKAPDLGKIDDFAETRAIVESVPGVESVVPMGLGRSIVWGDAPIETKLEELRAAIRDDTPERVPPLVAHVRAILKSMVGDLEKLAKVALDNDETAQQRADLARANSDEFWATFDDAPYDALEFLENRISPLGVQSGFYFFNYVGTDPQAFAKNFKLFRMESGQLIPPGERGFMFNSNYYERFVKHRTARRLDQIKEARELTGAKIALDEDLQRKVEHNRSQVTQITEQLDPAKALEVKAALQAELATDEDDLETLVADFLTVDDDNFDHRYEVFYREIAPRIRLYAYMVGDSVALYGQTKSGYPRAVNVKVWGVFRYEGLEKSGLAGVYNVMDMMSFRDLTGLSDSVSPEEIARLKAASGIEEVDRDRAEDELFGGDSVVEAVDDKPLGNIAETSLAGLRRAAKAAQEAKFTQDQLERGPVLNMAVFLEGGAALGPNEIELKRAEVESALAAAGQPQKVVPWSIAQGSLVAGLATGISVFFYGLVGLIFFVAFIVILNSLLMSTMERVQEIGTIRAMGAQRGFVLRMFAIEGFATAALFGALGIILGALTVSAAGASGIKATSEILFFVFGGRALHPILDGGHLAVAFVVILSVTLVSTLVPAIAASRIPPIAAMQAKE